ncbi:Hypothetical protein ACI5QL_02984 [Bacillus velezensis]
MPNGRYGLTECYFLSLICVIVLISIHFKKQKQRGILHLTLLFRHYFSF